MGCLVNGDDLRARFVADHDYELPIQKEIAFLVDQIGDNLHKLSVADNSFVAHRCLGHGFSAMDAGYRESNGFPERVKEFLEAMLAFVLDPTLANSAALLMQDNLL